MMRDKHLFSGLGGLREERACVCQLIFLHELSSQHTEGQPPREARWERILERPESDWPAAIDIAGRACVDQWPEQLDGFFEVPFEGQPVWGVKRAVETVRKVCAQASNSGGPADRRTVLADTSQQLRSLTAKQWNGAFFTPGMSPSSWRASNSCTRNNRASFGW